MRMRPVRHFSRALHQVSVCVRKSARHSQVRSPNMRTSQHIVAVSVRVVHIAPVSRGLHGQMRRVGTTCKPQRRSSLGKKSCSRYATIDDFSCTETQADGSYSERIPKRLFFFLRCRWQQQAKQQKKCRPSPEYYPAANPTHALALVVRARASWGARNLSAP
jgi:hypothetical protein